MLPTMQWRNRRRLSLRTMMAMVVCPQCCHLSSLGWYCQTLRYSSILHQPPPPHYHLQRYNYFPPWPADRSLERRIDHRRPWDYFHYWRQPSDTQSQHLKYPMTLLLLLLLHGGSHRAMSRVPLQYHLLDSPLLLPCHYSLIRYYSK